MSAKRLQNECEQLSGLWEQLFTINAEIRQLEEAARETRRAMSLLLKKRTISLLNETIRVLRLSPSVRVTCYKADLVLIYKIQHCINTGEWPKGVGTKTQAELTTELDQFWRAHGL